MQTEMIEFNKVRLVHLIFGHLVTSEQRQYVSCDWSYRHVTCAYRPLKLIVDPLCYVAGRTGFGCACASLFHLFGY